MAFKDDIASDLGMIFNADDLAEQIEYNGIILDAIVEIGEQMAKGNVVSPRGDSDRAFFYVQKTAVPSPRAHDTIVHEGKSWECVRVASDEFGVWCIEAIAGESAW